MSELVDALVDCDEEETLRIVREKIESQTPVSEIITECNVAMSELGQRFEDGDAFIPDLMFAGMLMNQIVDLLEPLMKNEVVDPNQKTLLIGTVKNDIHDIGKNITTMIFQGAGFKVVDLGVDVPPEKFVEAIREYKPVVVGMSLLLTTCYQSVFDTIEAIKNAGLRDSVKICVGGAAASQLLADKAGCDYYGATAVDTLRWARSV